jgi:putative FmdB family regulatory protein
MALYSYHCPKCGADFEVAMRVEEVGKKRVACPECKGRKVERVYTAFFAKTSRKS